MENDLRHCLMRNYHALRNFTFVVTPQMHLLLACLYDSLTILASSLNSPPFPSCHCHGPRAPIKHSWFVSMPWHQLCHIQTDVIMPVTVCMTILRDSSAILESGELTVSEEYSLSTTLSSEPPIHCPRLRSFKVDIHHMGRWPDHFSDSFFLLLRFPSLDARIP
jgi:hypothetical protein